MLRCTVCYTYNRVVSGAHDLTISIRPRAPAQTRTAQVSTAYSTHRCGNDSRSRASFSCLLPVRDGGPPTITPIYKRWTLERSPPELYNHGFENMESLGAVYSRVSSHIFGDWNACGVHQVCSRPLPKYRHKLYCTDSMLDMIQTILHRQLLTWSTEPYRTMTGCPNPL